MNFNIRNTEVYGIKKSVISSGNAMRTEMSDNMINVKLDSQKNTFMKDMKRSRMLGSTKCGEGHDNFLNGIIVQFDMYAPLYMWKQIQRYHFLDFISSQSTMHRLVKFKIKDQCVDETDNKIIDRYQELLTEYNNQEKGLKDTKLWRTLVSSLPCGFVLGATMTTNYRQLKTIYNQRKNHKLIEWTEFCDWCDSLPNFKELTGCFR